MGFILTHKNEGFNLFKHFCKTVEKEIGFSIIKFVVITEVNLKIRILLKSVLIMTLYTRFRHQKHHNKIVLLKKNRTLKEMAHTMLNAFVLPKYFWMKAVNTACYVLNRIIIRPILKKTPYELFFGKIPNISNFWMQMFYS